MHDKYEKVTDRQGLGAKNKDKGNEKVVHPHAKEACLFFLGKVRKSSFWLLSSLSHSFV